MIAIPTAAAATATASQAVGARPAARSRDAASEEPQAERRGMELQGGQREGDTGGRATTTRCPPARPRSIVPYRNGKNTSAFPKSRPIVNGKMNGATATTGSRTLDAIPLGRERAPKTLGDDQQAEHGRDARRRRD